MALFGIHHCQGSNINDFLHLGAPRQYVSGFAESQQNGSDRLCPTDAHEQLVSDIGGREVGEDQHIGGPFKPEKG